MNMEQLLRETLKFHGFFDAAEWLKISTKEVKQLLEEWRSYPECMNKYPRKLGNSKHPYRVSALLKKDKR